MVIQDYGNDPNEQDAKEEKESQLAWQREKERVAKTTPQKYKTLLNEIYLTTPHEKLSSTPTCFVDDIAWRVYTEACMNPEEKFDHDKYNGEALAKFIEDEVYFASARAIKKGLINLPVSSRTGDEIRGKVLEGVVKRAIELFSDWNGITQPPSRREEDAHGVSHNIYEDKRNLRDNLEAYVSF
jgi:hypothetical protein